MICAEWWAYEIIAIISGYFGVKVQAAQVVLANFSVLMFMFAVGLSTSTCTLIGKNIGKQDIDEAKRLLKVIQKISVCIILVVCFAFIMLNQYVFRIFTSDPEVLQQTFSVSIIVAAGIIPDYWQSMMNGCIRALGLQIKAIKYNIFAYWFMNIILIKLLAFHMEMNFVGIRLSMFSA
jgi:MATE family multidrug resistance protein